MGDVLGTAVSVPITDGLSFIWYNYCDTIISTMDNLRFSLHTKASSKDEGTPGMCIKSVYRDLQISLNV